MAPEATRPSKDSSIWQRARRRLSGEGLLPTVARGAGYLIRRVLRHDVRLYYVRDIVPPLPDDRPRCEADFHWGAAAEVTAMLPQIEPGFARAVDRVRGSEDLVLAASHAGDMMMFIHVRPGSAPPPPLNTSPLPYAEVHSGYTREKYRGQGLFNAAYAEILRELESQGIGHLWGCVEQRNAPSIKALVRAGAVLAGRQESWVLCGRPVWSRVTRDNNVITS